MYPSYIITEMSVRFVKEPKESTFILSQWLQLFEYLYS